MKRRHLAVATVALSLLTACGGGGEPSHHRTALPASGTTTSSTRTSGTASPAPAAARTGAAVPAAASTAVRTKDDGSRRLTIPVLGVDAPVTGCATQDGTVTPPSDIDAVCRWTGSQDFAATTGTTVVVGHSTRSTDTVGALEYVRELKVGDTATVAGQTWRVAQVLPGVDKHGLPAWIVDHSGPRQLALVTCETTSHTRNDLARLVPVG